MDEVADIHITQSKAPQQTHFQPHWAMQSGISPVKQNNERSPNPEHLHIITGPGVSHYPSPSKHPSLNIQSVAKCCNGGTLEHVFPPQPTAEDSSSELMVSLQLRSRPSPPDSLPSTGLGK